MTITTCCGCCSLQKGTIVIGFLHFISAVVVNIWQGINVSRMFSYESSTPRREPWVPGMSIGLLCYSIMYLVITGVLIIGAIRRVASNVFIFLCMNYANIMASFIYIVLTISTGVLIYLPMTTILILMTFSIIGISLQVYFWLVVYYFYKELMADKYRKLFQPNAVNYPHPLVPGMIYNS